MIALLLVLSWLPVTEDCLGLPEIIERYEVRGVHIRLLGWVEVEGEWQPVYSDRTPQDWRTSAAITRVEMSAYPLAVGDVVWYEVTAQDAAGNRSNGCAP